VEAVKNQASREQELLGHASHPPVSNPFVTMRFSPILVVAVATCLADSASASPFLFPRQAPVDSSLNVTDPHAAPAVPADFSSPISTGGVAWTDAYNKAKGLVDQMTVEEKVNITSGFPGACV
jgi:hypothetical protein